MIDADGIVAALRALVPAIPDEAFVDRRRPLRETIPHGRCFDVPEYNLTLLGDPPGMPLMEEARLIDHYYYGDRYWDRVTFALYRSTWDEVADGLRGEWPASHHRASADDETTGASGRPAEQDAVPPISRTR